MIFEFFCKIFLNKIKTSISSTFISNGALMVEIEQPIRLDDNK
jgi:hypothetical protein